MWATVSYGLHFPAMPLYARTVADHYPDRERPSADDFIVLSGRYKSAASIASRTGRARAAGRGALVSAPRQRTLSRPAMRNRPRSAGSTSPARSAQCSRAPICASDRTPGRDRRAGSRGAIAEPSPPTQPYDRENDILLGPMLRNELRITVRSGELIVGLLTCSTHGPETWSWALTGVERPDADFVWRGEAETQTEAFNEIAAAWAAWLYWAGLEAVAPLQRGGSR